MKRAIVIVGVLALLFSFSSQSFAAPGTPGTPTAGSYLTDGTGFTASWTASTAPVSKYYMDVCTVSNCSATVAGKSGMDLGNVLSYAISGLNGGTQYWVRLRAYDNGTSTYSSYVTSSAITTIPAAPVIQAGTSFTSTGFTANWSASTGATGYYLDVATDSGFSSMVSGYSNLNVGSVVTKAVTGLSSGVQYFYRVRAFNGTGTSGNSAWTSLYTYPAVPTSSPATSISATGFTANWSSVSGATTYLIDVSTSATFTSFVGSYSGFNAGNVTSYAVSGLSSGTTYYYRIRAVDNQGTNPTNSSSITVLTIPSTPAISAPVIVGATSFTATWSAVTGATYYQLDVSTDPGFATLFYTNASISGTSYTVTGLSPGTDYYYQVRACDSGGCSGSSGTQYTDFTPPTVVGITAGTSSTDASPVDLTIPGDLGGPYVRTTTPYITTKFSEQVTGIQLTYNSSPNIKLTLSTNTTALQLASGFVPATNTTPTAAGSPAGSPSPATFHPNSALTNGATYKVTITGGGSVTTGIRDLSGGSSGSLTGNPLLSPPAYTFTVDTTAPTVNTATSTPANNATGISPTTNMVINFTENLMMNYHTFAAIGNVVLQDSSGNTVTCTVSWSTNPYKTLTVTPADTLGYNTTYTLTLTNITDAAGNPLGTYTTSFTTKAASEATYSIVPPFVASSVVPNVLIILDNSNSMDEDMQGNAIGSFNCTDSSNPNSCSRSVLARQTLINLINTFANKINIGLMSYNLPSLSTYQLYNNFYFTSYDQRTYCPNPPQACQDYCTGEDPQPSNKVPTSTFNGTTGDYTPSANEAACLNACQAQNLHFQSNIRDPITTTNGMGSSGAGGSSYGNAVGSPKRINYCGVLYPKTGVYTDTTQTPAMNVYHGLPGTLYSGSSSEGIRYLFAGKPAQGSGTYYNSTDSASNTYYYYQNKVGQTDGFIGYSNYVTSGTFVPTDDDKALGFYNYGQTNMWYPPNNGASAPTWFANTAANPASGFLHVPVAANDSTNTQLNKLLNKIGAQGYKGNSSGYMTCTSGSGNTCDHIINAGITPTAGTLQSAINYLNGSLAASLTQANAIPATPIQYSCQKNYIIYVTDGLPSVDESGNAKDSSGTLYTATALTPAVLAKLAKLRCPDPTDTSGTTCNVTKTVSGTTTKYDVKTYVVGLAMTTQSSTLLDQMANAGGTDINPVNASGVNDNGHHAYYANDATTLNNAMVNIFQNILQDVSSGTAASILNNSQGSGANLLQAVFYPVKPFDSSTKASWIGELQGLWYYLDPYFQSSTVREDTNQDYILSLKDDYIVNFRFDKTTAKTVVDLSQDVSGNGKQLVSEGTGLSADTPKSLWKLGNKLWQRNISDSSTTSTYDPRNIYTVISSVPSTPDPNIVSGISPSTIALQKFSSLDADNFNSNTTAQQYLQVSTKSAANTLINYISGIDDPSGTYRGRKVTMLGCGIADAEGCTREWRLGDIIGSTPKLVSNNSLNSYSLMPPYGYNDTSYAQFTASTNYTNRGVAFVGGNDGMLHAVRLGILDVTPQTSIDSHGNSYTDRFKVARMMYPDSSGNPALASYTTSNLGREEWAFIPMNALPYLKYLGDPNYSHMYYVDDSVSVFDASINVPGDNDNSAFPNCAAATYENCRKQTEYGTGTSSNPFPLNMANTSWRTVLIGGMGLGGATRNNATTTCIDNVQSGTCVKTPLNGIGFSSYFALDVTNPATLPNSSDPNAVKFLWELNGNGQLGYSLSGPAVVRIGDPAKNGKWYAIFGSGPTGPIDTLTHTFYGSSDQNLKLFVVDIGTGTLVATLDTQISNAFAGTLAASVIDVDRNSQNLPGFYSDDAVYVGYVKQDSSTGTWTKGGVLRVLTKGDQNPSNWSYKTPLIDNIGPVTTSIAKLQDRTAKYTNSDGSTGKATGKLWIYFGTGRYFYNTDMASVSTPFQLYGVKDPCYSENYGSTAYLPQGPNNAFDTSCTTTVAASALANQTGSASAAPASSLADSYPGWYISLSLSETVGGSSYNSERVITNPVASGNGAVFFTTFSPAADVCGYGGNSHLWAVNYSTGAAPPAAAMQGTVLMQVSTGALTQISLTSAFSNPSNLGYNNRRLAQPITGVPPVGNGLALMSNPKPVKKILHYQEK